MGADLAVYILRSGSYSCVDISMGNLCTNDLPYDFTVGCVLCSFFVNIMGNRFFFVNIEF